MWLKLKESSKWTMLENLTKLGKFEEVYIPGRLHTAFLENYHEDFIIKNFPNFTFFTSCYNSQ